MLAASMEAPSYGASRLPFTIRHRPTLYVTKFASWVGSAYHGDDAEAAAIQIPRRRDDRMGRCMSALDR